MDLLLAGSSYKEGHAQPMIIVFKFLFYPAWLFRGLRPSSTACFGALLTNLSGIDLTIPEDNKSKLSDYRFFFCMDG
jgi:hypothetical protein